MPFCTNCGKEIAKDTNFCSNCGMHQLGIARSFQTFDRKPEIGHKSLLTVLFVAGIISLPLSLLIASNTTFGLLIIVPVSAYVVYRDAKGINAAW